MKLEFVEMKTKEENGTHYVLNRYTVGEYAVSVYDTFYADGSFRHGIEVEEPRGDTYLPHIYHRDDWFGRRVSTFEIQTTSYGSLNAKEFKKFLEAQRTALEVVEVLNAGFGESQEG